MGKNKKKNKYMLLLILLLGLSLGYALISTTLKITGSANINKNNWSIYFDNPVVTQGSVTTDLPEIGKHQWNQNNTKLRWNADFNIPGDFYEFTVDIVNAGSIDAIIDKVEFESSELPDCVTYSVKYNDGTSINEGDKILKATKSGNTTTPTTKKIKVRIEYNPDSAEEIDELDDETYNFDFSLNIFYIIDNPGSYTEEGVAGMYYAHFYPNPYDAIPQMYSIDFDLYDYDTFEVGDTLPLEFGTLNTEVTVNYNGGITKDYRDLNVGVKLYKDRMYAGHDAETDESIYRDYYFFSKRICDHWGYDNQCTYTKSISFNPAVFYGYEVDENRTIEAVYLCGVYNGEKYCLRDDSDYMNEDSEVFMNAAVTKMTEMFGEYDSVNGTGCHLDGQYNDYYICVSPDKTQSVTITSYYISIDTTSIIDDDLEAHVNFETAGGKIEIFDR